MSRNSSITLGSATPLRGGRARALTRGHDADFYAWTQRQAALLRAGRLDMADIAQVSEEIEDLGKAQRQKLERRIATVLEHLMKLDASVAKDPRAGWRETIRRSRREIAAILRDSRSLRPEVDNIIASSLEAIREDVAATLADHGEDARGVSGLTYTAEQVLGRQLPE